MAITSRGYAALAVVAAIAVVGIGKLGLSQGWIGRKAEIQSSIPVDTSIKKFSVNDNIQKYDLPVTATRVSMQGSCLTIETIPWMAFGASITANGGANTVPKSLMDKYTGGGRFCIKRQDDYKMMYANLTKFVTSNYTEGSAFIVIMGDAYPYVAVALNNTIKGKFEAVGAVGFSNGEDSLWLEKSVADKKGRGALIAAVPMDGDWNIAVKYASDNDIPINVDQKTYDPNAMNFVDVNMFTDANEKFIAKACEERTLVENGIKKGKIKVCTNGVATWTPGDVAIAQKYDGDAVRVASTADYSGQMPALIIGIKEFNAQHPDLVAGFLRATDRAAIAIRTDQNGLMAFDRAVQSVYQDSSFGTGDWAKYYKGTEIPNRAGRMVQVGGSKVLTLQEQRDYFGLRAGTTDIFNSVYNVFKNYDETFYSNDYPKGSIPEYNTVVNLTYLKKALEGIPENQGAVVQTLAMAAPITAPISNKAWNIEFDTGSANIKRSSMEQLLRLRDETVMTNLRLVVSGHTDNTGSDLTNVPLSQRRAEAVVQWLNQMAPNNYPLGRMLASGYGSTRPVCTDNSPACLTKNRRVEVTLGN